MAGTSSETAAQPLVVPRSEHCLSRRDIDPDALKTLFRLQHLGFTAYLTGGAVRDMLLGKRPKDFDIATDARPNQIRKFFANAFIIGRRFRLAHIRFRGGKVIEVATFRKDPGPSDEGADPAAAAPAHAFGTPAEDAWRRDITINALFYDPASASVIDFVGGLDDLRQGRIRIIGEAGERFREDPVRIWRVLRYAARLGFAVDVEIGAAIRAGRDLLTRCSAARLFEEFAKDLLGPRTAAVISLQMEYGILRLLLGRIGEAYEDDPALAAELVALLAIVDQAKERGREVPLAEVACFLFWPWAAPQIGRPGPDPFPVLKKAFLDAGLAVVLPKGLRAQVSDIMALAARLARGLQDGGLRGSLRQRPQYALAARLCFIAVMRREPGEGESFETLYLQKFPGRPAEGGRPRRRRRRRKAPAPPQ
jgi:poly(A) polymerase